METTVKERLILYLKYKNIGQKAFALSCGLSAGFVNAISKSIQPDTTHRISIQYPDLNSGWLLTGEGNMTRSNENIIHDSIIKALSDPSIVLDEAKKELNTRFKSETNDKTGYYYPEISASAGLEVDIANNTENKIPVNIPNWEKELIFINVYGDSMYPKYNAGEVIGVKLIEFDYLNYGFPYVVVFNNGDTYIKIVQPSDKADTLTLESVNPFYRSKDFHIGLIKHFYSIKGVIKREMI